MPKPNLVVQPESRPTAAQINYLMILFHDCGYSHKQRLIYMSDRVRRDIQFTDDLTPDEASSLIAKLKVQRGDKS